MSIFNDKTTKNVADAAAKIMEAELSAKQKQIAKISEPKHKIDAGDLAKLRAGHKPVKEEVQQIDELKKSTLLSYINKAATNAGEQGYRGGEAAGKGHLSHSQFHQKKEMKRVAGVTKAAGKLALGKTTNEDVEIEDEILQEYEATGGVYKHKGTYGGSKGAEYGSTDWDKEEKEAKKMTDKQTSRKLGARQNYVRSRKVSGKVYESFTDMISAYNENGLKSLADFSHEEMIQEEPDNETFTKELKDQEASMMGKKKQPSVAAASTQGVKQMPEEVEVIDANEVNGVTFDTIEERTLTEPETKKKEEVVKSMKKNLAGFKDRYGERGKSVMYATATKIAKEKA